MTEAIYLPMELRAVDVAGRRVVGVCVPYDETSYVVPHPAGERIKRGAFNKSINERNGQVFLNLEHDESRRVAKAVSFDDGDEGLTGEFVMKRSTLADEVLSELDEGYWPFMSVGFRPLRHNRGADGAIEVTEAFLGHVALVATPAYSGAQVLAVRSDADVDLLAWAKAPHPKPDLTPVPNWR